MEYSSYIELLEDKTPELSCSLVEIKENVCPKNMNPCNYKLSINDVNNYDNLNDKFFGFDTPSKSKLNDIKSLIEKIEGEIIDDVLEKDVIDGIEFLSFASEQELTDYTNTQMQDFRANASDDGLEILDDGTFSNISSNHAIVPTKTQDITRIKGWRNKHFAGINIIEDSRNSFRNDDDGFGDDIEMKVQDESSEEVESVGYEASIASKNDFEGDPTTDVDLFRRIDSPVIEDSNAVDNAEVFNLNKSPKRLTNDLGSSSSKISVPSNVLDFSFDNLGIRETLTPDKTSNITENYNLGLAKKGTHFILPLTSQDRQPFSLESKSVYQPRVKTDFIDMIARKVNADFSHEEKTLPSVSLNKVEKEIRWRVSKEKLLSGNIYDIELSTNIDHNPPDCDLAQYSDSKEVFAPGTSKSEFPKKGSIINCTDVKLSNPNISAFQSTTLDQYTTNLGKLHIDFPIPNLQAADNVTHEEIILPVLGSTVTVQERLKPKQVDKIRAKTVAEKRKLLTELSFNQRSKRQQKVSFKIRAKNEITDTKQIKPLREEIKKHKRDKKFSEQCQPLSKKSGTSKSLFDTQGVITYGKEKPLKSVFRKRLIAYQKSLLPSDFEIGNSLPSSSKIGMILNIGVSRPLFRETSDNVKRFALDGEGNITKEYALFSACAVQDPQSQFTVKRILVPVVDKTLQEIMSTSKNTRQIPENTTISNKNGNGNPLLDINLLGTTVELSEETKAVGIQHETNNDVLEIVNNMIRYVDHKELFENVCYNYDPDVPASYEQKCVESPSLETSHKRKKTRLQIQIEKLGGTFISVQGEEGNEENLDMLEKEKNCVKDSCTMGCVCPYRTMRVEHCGKESCMFSCQCPSFSRKQGLEIKSKTWLLPEVLRHHNLSQSKLAPVEREYHQTVIMSKDKRITIETKHNKRKRKLPSKYKDEILFDFRKDIDDDTFIVGGVNEKETKQNCNEYKELPKSPKKHLSRPVIQSLDSFLKESTFACKSAFKLSYVQIESSQIINQMAVDGKLSPTALQYNKIYNHLKKSKYAEPKSRNVARKKTGYSIKQHFNVQDFCSRTYGVAEDYVLRNHLGKIRTKNFMLYPSYQEKSFSLFTQPTLDNNERIVKEDLVENTSADFETENEIEEKNPNEEERGLQIEFVHSIPPHLFEEQEQSVEMEKTDGSSPICEIVPSKLPNSILNCVNDMENNTVIGRQDQFFYTALPKTENECKWWVVELDYTKFTDLIYYSEKRALSVAHIKKAIFDSQFTNTTIKIVLKNSGSSFKDIFGAYFVGGFHHLIFFGPYELSEAHGITAIRHIDEEFFQVPFISKNSKSEPFKPLGVNTSPMNEENSQSVLNAVNAVWLYSTSNKGTMKNTVESRSVQKTIFNVTTDNNKNYGLPERDIPTNESENYMDRTDDGDMVRGFEDDITIEQDPLKIEPLDYFEESIPYSSNGENCTDTYSKENDDCYMHATKNFHNGSTDIIRTESESVEVLENPVEVPSKTQAISSTSMPKLSFWGKVAKMKTSPFNKSKTSPVTNKRIQNTSLTAKEKHQKQDLNMNAEPLISLRKRIESLKNIQEAAVSKNIKSKEEFGADNTSDMYIDNTSLCDGDVNIESLEETSSSLPATSPTPMLKRRRITHKPPKQAPIFKEPTQSALPMGLVQKEITNGPCPEKALLCLTPGIGYIPVIQFDPRGGHIVIEDPSNPKLEHHFQKKSLAIKWLNQFFKNLFVFDPPEFEMQWLIMQGSIIRKLLPLNRDIFKFNNRSLTIRPTGLQMKQISGANQVDLEHQALSSPEKKIIGRSTLIRRNRQACLESVHHNKMKKLLECDEQLDNMIENPNRSGNHHLNQIAGPSGLQKKQNDDQSDLDYQETSISKRRRRNGRKSRILKKMHENKSLMHNEMEKLRRSELAELMNNLGMLVYPTDSPIKVAKVGVLNQAKLICMAQKNIEEQLLKEVKALKKMRDTLNQKLKNIFADIWDPEEKKKALGICKYIRCKEYTVQDKNEKYLSDMKIREIEHTKTLPGNSKYMHQIFKEKYWNQGSRPSSQLSMSSSSGSCSGSMNSIDTTSPEVNKQHKPSVNKKPTEGVLVKSKLRSIAASRPHLKIFPASSDPGEVPVIDLIDDNDNEEETIVLESEEEEVIWLPPTKEQSENSDDDIEILSSNFKPKRPMLIFPKPKRNPQRRSLLQKRTSLLNEETSATTSSSPCEAQSPAPVALVLSPAVMEQHRLANETEFVAVDECDYEPLFSEFKSGCSRTDPVPEKYLSNRRLASKQFIPIQQTSLSKPISLIPSLQLSNTSTAPKPVPIQPKPIPIKKLATLLSPSGLTSLKPRGEVLVTQRGTRIQLSKMPKPVPHVTPLSATPVTITGTSSVSACETASSDTTELITLHHPSLEGVSQTRAARFENLNSVQLVMPSPLLKCGPKMWKPKDDGIPPQGIKVMYPKRK